MYSLHLPSVTVNCVDCYRNDHCKFCTKFFVRLMPQIYKRSTDCPRFPRSISVKSIVAVMSQMRVATRKFAIATMRRNFATNFHSARCPPLFVKAMQGRQRFLEVRSMPYQHRVGTHKIWTDPPVATIYINFFFCGNMGVVFVRKSVHLKDYFFRATQLDQSLSEPRVTDKSIVNVFVFSFFDTSLNLSCRVEFFTTKFLPVPVTVWPAFPDAEVREREDIQHGRDVLLVFCCIISQEMSTRAVDDANVPIRQTCSALCFRLHVDCLAVFSVPSSFDRIFWFFSERIECSMLLKITLKCLLLRGGSRSSESSCERWRHVIVSPSNSAHPGCWSRCSPHRLQSWTRYSRLMMQCHDVRQNQILPLYVCLLLVSQVPRFYREHAWSDCLQTSQVSLFYLKNSSSSCKRLPSISCERDVFFFSTKTRSVSSGFPDRSQIGLGLDWVGLENSARGASPKDCWTSFTTGCCSTVEPNWSFPLVQLWSCFNEIYGGGREDKYRLSYNISPVFNPSTFEIQWAGSVPWRIITFDRVW